MSFQWLLFAGSLLQAHSFDFPGIPGLPIFGGSPAPQQPVSPPPILPAQPPPPVLPAPVPERADQADGPSPSHGESTWQPVTDLPLKPLSRVCDGRHTEQLQCENLAECPPCVPEDCVWSAWGEWSPEPGCTQLKQHSRGIKVAQTQCPDGTIGKPCEGVITETALLKATETPKECQGDDCVFSNWTEWSNCSSSQRTRTRLVHAMPKDGGRACEGALKETEPCGGAPVEDCDFMNWQAWTDCSASCGQGRWTRMRRVKEYAAAGGKTCEGTTLEQAPCALQPCDGKDCILSQWSQWEGSCSSDNMQKVRRRNIDERPEGDGRPCNKSLVETEGCFYKPKDCIVSPWSSWSDCDSICGPGQRLRTRDIQDVEVKGGRCPETLVKEMQPCSTGACTADQPHPCEWSEWDTWSQCDAECDFGTSERKRQIKSLATNGGASCTGPLHQAKACTNGGCEYKECEWDEWQQWSDCTLKCGGGSQRRMRGIKVFPSGPNAKCPAEDKAQIQPCNTQSCGEGCKDEKWNPWGVWGEWSATCGPSYRSQERSVQLGSGTACGKKVSGSKQVFETANLTSCIVDQDCLMDQWSEWGQCSADCSGVTTRARRVLFAASGSGNKCEDDEGGALEQMSPCNPKVGDVTPTSCLSMASVDCAMGEWEEWSTCSQNCGGGEMERKRRPLQDAAHGGKPCNSSLLIAAACNTQACPEPDHSNCEWSTWAAWSACSGCKGQKFRSRAPSKMPTFGGKPCSLTSAKEIADCTGDCPTKLYCTWNRWSEGLKECDACGTNTRTQTRTLGWRTHLPDVSYLFATSDDNVPCTGSQTKHDQCSNPRPCDVCQPRDCQLGLWSEWTGDFGLGLCERHRVVNQSNNECGEPCAGTLIQTTLCHNMGSNRCELSDWSDWEDNCRNNKVHGQKTRQRHILKKGGRGCIAPLEETQGCNMPTPVPCAMTTWTAWSPCNAGFCDYGFQTRKRHIETYAQSGGDRCNSVFKETRTCKLWAESCGADESRDCELSKWSNWTECDLDGQQYSDRMIAQEAYKGGSQCTGALHRTETCKTPVDCALSQWTPWSDCDVPCGNGQQTRQRQVTRLPKYAGKSCEPNLMETKGCQVAKCPSRDAKLMEWSAWSVCDADCGSGTSSRSREIARIRDPGGEGQTAALAEMRVCTTETLCVAQNCRMGDWGLWSKCTGDKTCGAGVQERNRSIIQKMKHGGDQCKPGALTEAKGCDLGPCKVCKDGTWDVWEQWSACTASCGGGTTFRIRTVGTQPDDCGLPPAGKDHVTGFCNVQACGESKDCEMDQWTTWSDCNAKCDGHQKATRVILGSGAGDGAQCFGATSRSRPCHPGQNQPRPTECQELPRLDCKAGDWLPWSDCSTKCDPGQKLRQRKIEHYAQNGGNPCQEGLEQITECNRDKPCSTGPPPVNCKLGDWEVWGECNVKTQDRKRWKRIAVHASNNGTCSVGDMQEVGPCTIEPTVETYCDWNAWEGWSVCSVTCGSRGFRKRDRTMLMKTRPISNARRLHGRRLQEQDAETDSLYQRAQELQSGGSSEFFVAFCAGAGGLMALFAASSAIISARRSA